MTMNTALIVLVYVIAGFLALVQALLLLKMWKGDIKLTICCRTEKAKRACRVSSSCCSPS